MGDLIDSELYTPTTDMVYFDHQESSSNTYGRRGTDNLWYSGWIRTPARNAYSYIIS